MHLILANTSRWKYDSKISIFQSIPEFLYNRIICAFSQRFLPKIPSPVLAVLLPPQRVKCSLKGNTQVHNSWKQTRMITAPIPQPAQNIQCTRLFMIYQASSDWNHTILQVSMPFAKKCKPRSIQITANRVICHLPNLLQASGTTILS